jgi:hypothetical protein
MNAEEEKLAGTKALAEYPDVKKALVILQEEAHQLGEQLVALGDSLESEHKITNIAVDCYQMLLSKDYCDVTAHLQPI